MCKVHFQFFLINEMTNKINLVTNKTRERQTINTTILQNN